MAPLSHMVVYNYNSCTDNKSNSVDNTKILVNKLLSYMKSSGNRFIYIIDIECEHQSSTTNLANSNSNPARPGGNQSIKVILIMTLMNCIGIIMPLLIK